MSVSSGTAANALATESCRRAPPSTTRTRPSARIRYERRIGRVRLGQRHHDQPDRLATGQCLDDAIEHGASTQLEELLGNGRAETRPLAAGSDNGSNAHAMNAIEII